MQASQRETELVGDRNFLCLEAFRALLDYKLNVSALIETTVAGRLNRGKMDEHIFPVLSLNKAKTLGCIEPLNNTFFFHCNFLLKLFEPLGFNYNQPSNNMADCVATTVTLI